jgi:hypothetical protein
MDTEHVLTQDLWHLQASKEVIVYFITSLESDLLRGKIAFTRETKPSVEKAIEPRNSTFETSIERYFSLQYRKFVNNMNIFVYST